MFFVVHFSAHGKYVIVPKTWIHRIDDHWEKFVNNSINRNQTFLCYYSEHAINVEGRPDPDFLPDFRIPVNANFPGDGCYYANLICFRVSFDDALKVLLRRRANSIPAVYNAQRLNEFPIPDIQHDVYGEDNPIAVNRENTNNSSVPDENETIGENDSQFQENDHDVTDVQIDDEVNNENINDSTASDENENIGDTQSQSNQQVVANAQNEDEINGNTQIGEDNDNPEAFVESEGIRGMVDSNVQQSQSRGSQNDETSGADQFRDNQRNTQKDDISNGVTQNDQTQDSTAPTNSCNRNETTDAQMTHYSNEDELTGDLSANGLAETSDSFGPELNSETSIQGIFIPVHAENIMINSDSDETEIDYPTSEPNAIQTLDPVKIEPVPIYEPIQANDNELNELLDEEDMVTDEYDDDITIVIDSKVGFAMPLNANSDGLIKQQNDVVSGNIPFNKIKKGREYKYGQDKLFVPNKVVDKLKRWNTHPEKATEDYDRRATVALLLICVEPNDLVEHNISQKVKDVINDFLSVRTGGDASRLAKVEQFIADFCQKKAQQASQNNPMTAT